MGKWRLKEFDQSAQGHTVVISRAGICNQSWAVSPQSPHSGPHLRSYPYPPQNILTTSSADRKQKPLSQYRAHQISQT